jgi:hypothetical protein
MIPIMLRDLALEHVYLFECFITMNPPRHIGCLLASALLSSCALSKSSLQTNIIPGGEVAIQEVEAWYDGKGIALSGTGFEIFPQFLRGVGLLYRLNRQDG